MKACRGWEREGEGMAQGQRGGVVGLGVASDSKICCSRNSPKDGREEGKRGKYYIFLR